MSWGHMGGDGRQDYRFLIGSSLGLVVVTHVSFYSWEGALVLIVQEDGRTAELLWIRLEKRKSLASFGVPTPIFRARSHSTG